MYLGETAIPGAAIRRLSDRGWDDWDDWDDGRWAWSDDDGPWDDSSWDDGPWDDDGAWDNDGRWVRGVDGDDRYELDADDWLPASIVGGAGSDTLVVARSYEDFAFDLDDSVLILRDLDTQSVSYVTGIDQVDFDDLPPLTPTALVPSALPDIDAFDDGIYRFRNRDTGQYFLTADLSEANVVRDLGPAFAYEGVAFRQLPGGAAVHRFYNPDQDSHFFTISPEEVAMITAALPQYRHEGEAFRAGAAPQEDMVPVYRFYNGDTGGHFFTASEEERVAVLAEQPGFDPEGVAFYVPG